jgi:hypothetical protein
MKQKGIAPTIILVFIALAIVGYFGYKNYWPGQQTIPTPTAVATTPATSDPMANWKILNNSAGNFSLKYPDTYKAIGSGMDVDETTANEVYITQNLDGSNSNLPVIHIDAIDKKGTVYKDVSLKDLVQADFDANKANKNTLIEMIGGIKSTSFAGEPAYTFEMNSKGFSGEWHGFMDYTGINEVLEFEHEGIHFIIVYAKNPELVQILSTFRFLEKQ